MGEKRQNGGHAACRIQFGVSLIKIKNLWRISHTVNERPEKEPESPNPNRTIQCCRGTTFTSQKACRRTHQDMTCSHKLLITWVFSCTIICLGSRFTARHVIMSSNYLFIWHPWFLFYYELTFLSIWHWRYNEWKWQDTLLSFGILIGLWIPFKIPWQNWIQIPLR